MSACKCALKIERLVFQLKVKFGGKHEKPRRRGSNTSTASSVWDDGDLTYPVQVTSRKGSPVTRSYGRPESASLPVLQDALAAWVQKSSNSLPVDLGQPDRLSPRPPGGASRLQNKRESWAFSMFDQLSSYEKGHEQLQCLYDEAKKELEVVKQRNEELEEEKKVWKETVCELEKVQQELNKWKGFYDEQFKKNNELKERIVKDETIYKENMKKLSHEIERTKEQLRKKDDALNKAKAMIADLQKKKEQMNKNYDDDLERMAQIQTLQEELKKATRERDSTHKELDETKAENKDLIEKLNQANTELDAEVEKNKRLRKEFEDLRKQMDRGSFRRESISNSSTSSGGGPDTTDTLTVKKKRLKPRPNTSTVGAHGLPSRRRPSYAEAPPPSSVTLPELGPARGRKFSLA